MPYLLKKVKNYIRATIAIGFVLSTPLAHPQQLGIPTQGLPMGGVLAMPDVLDMPGIYERTGIMRNPFPGYCPTQCCCVLGRIDCRLPCDLVPELYIDPRLMYRGLYYPTYPPYR